MANRTGKVFDFALVETGDGGDYRIEGNDIALIYGHENQVYIALFGGNVEQNTPSIPQQNERQDYWANRLLWDSEPEKQFNSNTERTLGNTVLNSSGRLTIEDAVKEDLKYLSGKAEVAVEVTIPKVNTVSITIKTIYNEGPRIITVITYRKKLAVGDFSRLDFNSDFF